MSELSGDPNDPFGVASPQRLTCTFGGNQLNLYAGIALPEWRSDDDQMIRGEVVVRLPGPVGPGLEATAYTRLASLDTTGDSEFVLATDAARIERDTGTADVLLHVDAAVQGNTSYLLGFGYHVCVLDRATYTAVFHPSLDGEHQIYDATFDEFQALYDQLYPQGWRVRLLQEYAIGDQVRYTAVFHPSLDGEHQIYDATFDEFQALYDQLYPQGWRVRLLQEQGLG
jgi:hypothetical protein